MTTSVQVVDIAYSKEMVAGKKIVQAGENPTVGISIWGRCRRRGALTQLANMRNVKGALRQRPRGSLTPPFLLSPDPPLSRKFGVYDIEDENVGLLETLGQLNAAEGREAFPIHGVTYVVISYVMIYVSTDAVCNMLARLLRTGGAYCILVSERGEKTHSLGMMEARGVAVHRLIDQDLGVDERQSAWLDEATPLRPPPGGAAAVPTTFPNVPEEDSKRRKLQQRRY